MIKRTWRCAPTVGTVTGGPESYEKPCHSIGRSFGSFVGTGAFSGRKGVWRRRNRLRRGARLSDRSAYRVGPGYSQWCARWLAGGLLSERFILVQITHCHVCRLGQQEERGRQYPPANDRQRCGRLQKGKSIDGHNRKPAPQNRRRQDGPCP